MSESVADATTLALEHMVKRMENKVNPEVLLPADWLERYFWVPEPRDVVTGAILPPGPIRLAPHQRRLINEALRRDAYGMFVYTTVIYSAVKKSGKSALTSGVAFYMASTMPNSHFYCLANDGKSSTDRLYEPIRKCLELHTKHGGPLKGLRPNLNNLVLKNGSKIEAVPCDAAGEAGAEPTGVFFTELWGFESELKRRLFTEMTIPPTKFGRAIRWVESYAGFKGTSELLWNLYDLGVLQGIPHPDFLDLTSEGQPVVFTNPSARMFCYWDHEPRMVWQTPEFYAEESKTLSPPEFDRVHRNHWVSPTGVFIQNEWWDACADDTLLSLQDSSTPVVLAIDASDDNDCTAIVAVTRDPVRPATDVAVRAAKIFRPVPGKTIVNQEETIGPVLIDWGSRWNIVCIAYDAYQMSKLVQDYRRGMVTLDRQFVDSLSPEELAQYMSMVEKAVKRWYYKFSQHSQRSVADKQLYDMIVNRQIHWNPQDTAWDIAPRGNDDTLSKHLKQAGASQGKGEYRLLKLSNDLKIDGAVALSMAVERCMALTIDNREYDPDYLKRLQQSGRMPYNEMVNRLKQRARARHGK